MGVANAQVFWIFHSENRITVLIPKSRNNTMVTDALAPNIVVVWKKVKSWNLTGPLNELTDWMELLQVSIYELDDFLRNVTRSCDMWLKWMLSHETGAPHDAVIKWKLFPRNCTYFIQYFDYEIIKYAWKGIMHGATYTCSADLHFNMFSVALYVNSTKALGR